MAHAIKLTEENLDKIPQEVHDKSLREIRDWLVKAYSLNETRYIVFNVTINGYHYPWANLREDYFLEHFDFIDPARTNKICLA